MILIYTGEGKGKTSACVGQTVRALGAGLRVGFVQFMKRDGQAGEQKVLAGLLGENFAALGAGFYRNRDDYPRHRAAVQAALDRAASIIAAGVDLLVLDETLYALGAGLLTPEEVSGLVNTARERGFHLVLSGRGLPEWLAEAADLVTEMREIKHPSRLGVKAQAGIEF